MRYQFVGFPVPYKGRTVWEIVGNLKNFGLGRIIVEDQYKDKFVNPHFYKIVQVQPLETPQKVGHNRRVLLWAEYVLRGRKLSKLELLEAETGQTKFHLIPKEEEVNYLNGITVVENAVVPKYQRWPPLLEMIWKQRYHMINGKPSEIPPLRTIIDESEKSFETISDAESVAPVINANLYLSDKTVEDLYKELLILKEQVAENEKEEEAG